MAQQFTTANFEAEVEQSDIPVLVDFFADWCGPCKMMAPLVDQMATKYEGKVKVGKVNVDENQELAMRFRVMSIPTFILFKNGQPANTAVGGMDPASFEKFIQG